MWDKVINLTEVIKHHVASGSRSSILVPLGWIIWPLIISIFLACAFKIQWLVIAFFVILVVIVILYVYAYLFCLSNDRDCLRSERFSIQKIAIEKGLIGDNLQGIIEIDADQSGMLPSPNKSASEEGESK